MLSPETLQLLCDPYTKDPLDLVSLSFGKRQRFSLVCRSTGRHFPVRQGFVDFLAGLPLASNNRKYQRLYNVLSPFYDLVTRTGIRLLGSTEREVRLAYLHELEIAKGDRVLEVSIGTGANLRHLPPHASYFGLEISPGQLWQCRKMLKKTGLKAELFLGQAEFLPFRDNSFDIVLHVGGINFFSNPALAIREMYRVAKPGKKILILDETEKFCCTLARLPVVGAFFRGRGAFSPLKLVPPQAYVISADEIFNGRLWRLSFRKGDN